MGEEIVTFGNIEIEKNKFYNLVYNSYFFGDVYIEKVLVATKISFSQKSYKYYYWLLV